LKTEESVDKNVIRATGFLIGNTRFVDRQTLTSCRFVTFNGFATKAQDTKRINYIGGTFAGKTQQQKSSA